MNLSTKPVYELAGIIEADWNSRGKGVSPYAAPYLSAMYALTRVEDNYFLDSGDSVIRYFLANASGWRGDTAKAVKAELKSRL